MSIFEITTIGGRTDVLGRPREFNFQNGRLQIDGLTYADVQDILQALGRPSAFTPEQLTELGRVALGAAPKSPLLRQDEEARGKPRTHVPHAPLTLDKEAFLEDAAKNPVLNQEPEQEAAPAAEAPAEAPKRRGRPPMSAEQRAERDRSKTSLTSEPAAAKPEGTEQEREAAGGAAMSDVLARAAQFGQQLTAPAEEGDAPAEQEEASAPAEEPAAAQAPAERPRQAAAPAAAAAPPVRRVPAQERSEARGPRELVDDAEDDAERPPPVAAAPKATAPKAAPAQQSARPAQPAAQKPAQGPRPAPANNNGGAAAANGKAAAPEGTKSAPRNWLLDPNNLPKAVYDSKSMRGLVTFFIENGIKDVDRIFAECTRVKDKVPMFTKIPDLKVRIESALELAVV